MNQTATAPLNAEEKRRQMAAYRWFHSIDLGDGVVTKGVKPPERLAFQAARIFRFPIAGQSVLDIGCWDGFFAFEAKRRGASRVLAADHHVWTHGWGKKAAFELARRCVEPSVELREIELEKMTPASVGEFDVVLHLGILNHLKNPLAAMEQAAALTRRMLVVETHVDTSLPAEPPAMRFYPFDELNNNASNWWGPNVSCVHAMLQVCGFKRIEVDTDYSGKGQGRALLHAFR